MEQYASLVEYSENIYRVKDGKFSMMWYLRKQTLNSGEVEETLPAKNADCMVYYAW